MANARSQGAAGGVLCFEEEYPWRRVMPDRDKAAQRYLKLLALLRQWAPPSGYGKLTVEVHFQDGLPCRVIRVMGQESVLLRPAEGGIQPDAPGSPSP